MNSKINNGRFELIIGPMFSGKSSELIRITNRYKSIGKNILAINHSINNRYDTTNISTHDKMVLDDCITTDNLNNLKNTDKYINAEIIIIEELQFFNGAYDFVVNAVDTDGKIVIAAGLNGDFKRQPFGDILRLIPFAEKLTSLSALCKKCGDGTAAHFNKILKNINSNGEQIIVGSNDKFESVCRKHYMMDSTIMD